MEGEHILKRLEEVFKIDENEFLALKVARIYKDPFILLIATLLTQNTNERNAFKAFNQLKGEIGLSQKELLNARIEDIASALRPGGLHWVKAKAIKQIAEKVEREFNGSLGSILRLPPRKAREKLISLPRVGFKTADVVLLNLAEETDYIPIDTHIERVVKKLGIAPEKAGYREIQEKLSKIFNKKDYLRAHLLLILLGRRICKSRNPLCGECPLNNICNYYNKVKLG